MRLASKMFLTSALVVGVLAVVGVLGLRAVGRLASVNREITTRTVPALRLATSTRDAVPLLVRLEARFLVLHDPRFIEAWSERGERLRTNLTASGIRDQPRRGAAPRRGHRDLRALPRHGGPGPDARRARRANAGAIALSEGASRALAERVEATLEALTESMHADVLAGAGRGRAPRGPDLVGRAGGIRGGDRAWRCSGAGSSRTVMTQSLETLSAATAAVAAGSFEEQIVVDSKDEVGELARSFNTMARELRRMEETKEEFFASVSHELRSPLTSIREGAHLLRERVSGTLTDKQRRLVEIIAAGSDRLLGLVNQILEVSRLRAGVLPIQRVRLDLNKVVTRAVEEPQADRRPDGREPGA